MRWLIIMLAVAVPATAQLDGIRCEKTSKKSCYLAEGNIVAGVELPKGSRAAASSEGGWWAQFPHPVQFGELVCDGSGVEGPMTTFYTSRKLRSCYLTRDTVVQGVPCRHGGFWTDVIGVPSYVRLHETGSLARCEIARTYARDGHSFRKGDEICIDESGRVARCSGPQ